MLKQTPKQFKDQNRSQEKARLPGMGDGGPDMLSLFVAISIVDYYARTKSLCQMSESITW